MKDGKGTRHVTLLAYPQTPNYVPQNPKKPKKPKYFAQNIDFYNDLVIFGRYFNENPLPQNPKKPKYFAQTIDFYNDLVLFDVCKSALDRFTRLQQNH